MRSNKVAPNARTCAALLECCLASGRPQAAVGLVEEMRAAGVREDVVTSTLLLRCHLAEGDAAAAAALLERMEGLVSPDASAPDARRPRGRSKKSRKAKGPNLVTYNAAITGFVQLKAWPEALDALDRAAARFDPNQQTWAALAGAARDRDRGADVLYDALRVLMRRGRAVGSKAYEAWLLAAARANEREKAELLANARADGRLAILHGAGRERRRAFDDGERVDAPARLLEMERTVVSRGEVYAADGH